MQIIIILHYYVLFIYFTDLGLGEIIKPISRRKLDKLTEQLFEKKLSSIKERMKFVKYICTTSDLWSSRKRSFLGVTAHWVILVTG